MDERLFIIDRFEGDWAVVEYGKTMINIPKSLVPIEALEGDVLNIAIKVDNERTERRKKEIEELTKDLFTEE